jgi:formylglycine-generating enzyme required for sulfatase activity
MGTLTGGPEFRDRPLAGRAPDPNKSQWYLACAGPKSQRYPYGPTLQNGACNDGTGKDRALADVAQFEKCQGYYRGLFDMLGNAQEWTATCIQYTAEHDTCERIGGSYESTKVCSDSGAAERGVSSPKVGFRCCSQ